jgi:hypothetical protein
MRRLLAAVTLVCAAGLAMPAHADPPDLGGSCDNPADVLCRDTTCQPDELDCGMKPICLVWVQNLCLAHDS